MSKPFIIPQAKTSLIAIVVDGKINIIRPIAIPYQSISRITANSLIATQCTALDEFRVYDINANLLHKKPNCKYRALAVKKNTVYLGGEYTFAGDNKVQGEMFSIINLNDPDFTLTNPVLPIKVVPGKSIDDILVRDDQLLLVDNVIYPKYLIRYDITDPGDPKHVKTEQLPRNGSYEHIIKGDISGDNMVIFSTTFGRMGGARHIRITGKASGHLQVDIPFDTDPQTIPGFFKDICLVDDRLFILTTEGVRILDLKQPVGNENIQTITTNFPTFDKLIKTPNNEVIGVNESNYELLSVR